MRVGSGSGTAHLRAVHSAPLHVVGAGSYVLRSRPEDDGAMWPALAGRCRREAKVREFFHWLQSLPNTERVSIECERREAAQRDTPA